MATHRGSAYRAEAWKHCLLSDRVLPIDDGIAFAFFSNDRFASNRGSLRTDLEDRADRNRHPDPA